MSLTVWLPKKYLDRMKTEADAWFPRETGGSFMGYHVGKTDFVVTRMIEAGPDAIRTETGFEPSQAYQLLEIQSQYQLSGRLDAYLGDWHTHPQMGAARLSRVDMQTLKAIATSPGARQPNPLMLILYRVDGGWDVLVKTARIQRHFLGMIQRLEIASASLKIFIGQT